MALWIVRVIGDPPLEVLDRRFRRGRIDVGEHERPGFVPLRHDAVQAQVDRPRAAAAADPPHARIVDCQWLIVDLVPPPPGGPPGCDAGPNPRAAPLPPGFRARGPPAAETPQ